MNSVLNAWLVIFTIPVPWVWPTCSPRWNRVFVLLTDVVMMLEQMGYDTGIDLQELMNASQLAATLTTNAPGGRAKAWLDRHLSRK